MVMALLPVGASYFLLSEVLETSLSISFQNKTETLLKEAQTDLKALKENNPENEAEYRSRFQEIQDLLDIYSESALIRKKLSGSLTIYFFVMVSFVVMMSVLVAYWFGRRADRLYRKAVESWQKEFKRSQYLSEIASWQDVARRLAHELKNRATPLQVLSSALPKLVKTFSGEVLQAKIDETSEMMQSELSQLKTMTDSFSEFAKLPGIRSEKVSLVESLSEMTHQLKLQWTELDLNFKTNMTAEDKIDWDPSLIKQALQNLVLNAVEANLREKIETVIEARKMVDHLEIKVSNTGKNIESSMCERIFDPYFSTKAGKENMGLGLAIVKKIISDHQGEISCLPQKSGATFLIQIPFSKREDT